MPKKSPRLGTGNPGWVPSITLSMNMPKVGHPGFLKPSVALRDHIGKEVYQPYLNPGLLLSFFFFSSFFFLFDIYSLSIIFL